MRRLSSITLAATLFASVAGPALADWDRIGSVDITRGSAVSAYSRFGGRVESLNLTARNADVMCRDVKATFGNGETRTVFSGAIRRGDDRTLDLPGRERMVRRIDFDCRPAGGPEATIDIAADVGNYRDEWRRSPDWATTWSRMFAWADERPDRRDRDADRDYRDNPENRGWARVGIRMFEGRRDVDTAYPGFEGRNIDSIGLRPLNDDARCSRVTATFRNGRTRVLDVEPVLRQDRITRVDLPGRDRDVTRINMMCHALNGRQVTLEVLTQS